jgi:hypothetical protein
METRSFLTETQLRERVPAAFSSSPEPGVSKHYTFVPTFKVIENFKKVGWFPVSARMNNSKGVADYGKHTIRFGNKTGKLEVKEIVPEIVWMNSHDRSFSSVLEMGLGVCVCSNQLVVSESTFSRIMQKHININFEVILKVADEAIKQFDILGNKIEEYKTINLTKIQKDKFAYIARNAYWGEDSIINPKLLLNTRRVEDESDSLWKTYNVIQENIQKGGISYVGPANEEGKLRKRTTRETKNIVRDFQINQTLWAIMNGFAVNRKF